MKEVKVIYKKKKKSVENVSTYLELANELTRGRHQFLVCKVNGKLTDLTANITENNFEVEFFDFESPEGKDVYWHSSAHILAQAVLKLYPNAKYTIGPSIDKGFYYDFDMGEERFHPEDAEKIEAEAKKIIENDYDIKREELSKADALKVFNDNPYKTEIIKDLDEDAVISTYTQGDFKDLCRGPHLPKTSFVKAFKVMSFAGAYWRGNSDNQMLQRVYAISFPSDKELKKYINNLEEAKKRDHRKLGKELDLFSFHEEGPGFPFWHAKGSVLFNLLVDFMRSENTKRGYVEIKTPPILNDVLWKRSGHWDNYKENMYFTEIDEDSYAVKPMNCPGGILVYNTKLHSYRDLPLKQAEFGLVHRHELSGVLHGLFRVRSFTQDDSHVFCMLEQLHDEIRKVVEYILFVYKTLGFEKFKIFIATRPEHSIGSDENWEAATNALSSALESLDLEFEYKEGEGAFYGPKIEFNIQDSLERNWQCGTCQVDFSMPQRLEATYEGSDGQSHYPIMLHQATLGSFERLIGILLEHYAGKLPVWLSPVQARIINVSEHQLEFCQKLKDTLIEQDVRVDWDFRNESLGYKVREARNQRLPFILVVGDKEKDSNTLAVRDRKNKTTEMSIEDFVKMIKESNKDRK